MDKASRRESGRVVTFEEVEMEEDDDEEDEEDVREIRSAEIVARPSYSDKPIPPGAVVKERIPRSTICNECGIKTDDICFFCDYGICKRHSVGMQIVTDTGKFGNVIESCPECADRKNGKQAKQDEASEVGFFFKVKPYHVWKIIR
jgi:hypothetical protein